MRGKKIANIEMDWQVPWKLDPAAEKESHVYLAWNGRRISSMKLTA
jgi:hypothetical protein